MRKFTLWVTVCFLMGVAQLAPLASAQIRERAIVSFQSLNNDTSVRNQAEAWLGHRWLLDADGNSLLLAGVSYRKSWIPVNPVTGAEQLQMVVPTVTLVNSLNPDWTLVASLRVGAFSDFKNFGIQDMRVEGGVFFDKMYSDTLTIGYGVGRVSNFGRVIFVPLLHVLKNFGDQFLLDALLPGKLDFWYFPSPKWELGFTAAIIGSRYRLTDRSNGVASLGVAEIDLGPNIRYQLAPQFYLGLEGGVGIARKLNLYNANSDPIIESKPKTAAFARLGLSLRF